MRAVALVESVDHVSVRYRLAAFRPALQAAGHTLDLIPFAPTLHGRLRQYKLARAYDLVILQRTLLPSFELAWLRKRANILIFDFDDAIWRRDSYSPKCSSSKRLRRFRNIVRVADLVIAGNDFLAEHAPRAVVIPSCVPLGKAVPMHAESENLSLVWVGSSSTLKSLEAMASTLQAIGTACPDVSLKIICDRFANFHPLKTVPVRWMLETEAEEIASSQVGIAVMPDDDWSRGKCGVKVLQYLAAGLPVIANPVGVHREMVPGAGLLAETSSDWIAAVKQLRDPVLRARCGRNGQARVGQRYCLEAGAAAWLYLLERLERRTAC